MNPSRWNFEKKPLLVFWETTKACMLACKHCRANAILEPLPGELSTREALGLVDQIAEFEKPHPILVFTGGDPLMRNDLLEIIDYATSLDIPLAISPSATPLLTRSKIKELASHGIGGASLSLDSPFEEVHDRIRGVKGTFKRTIDAIKWFLEEGVRVQVNTVVMRETLEGLPEMVALLRSLGVKTWEVFYFVPTGRGSREHDLSPSEWEAVSFFLAEASRYGITVRTSEGPFFRRVACLLKSGVEPGDVLDNDALILYESFVRRLRSLLGKPEENMRVHTVGTRDGLGIVFVSYNGSVQPSGFLPLSAGNIRERPLKEIYINSILFKMLRSGKALKGRCGACEFKHICGGSRARAYALTGDPFAEDPACPYRPGSFLELGKKCGVRGVHTRVL